MSKNPQSLVNINGAVLDAGSVDLPDRRFREAWQYDGKVVSVHMPTAKRIRAEQLVTEARDKAEKAERRAAMKQLQMADAQPDEAEVAKFRGRPKVKALAKLRDAKAPEELQRLTVDELF